MDKPTEILIVDDDSKIRKTLFDILKAKNFMPAAVETGAEAIEHVKNTQPAVALIDLRLEDISGLEVLKAIKAYAPSIECIVITGYASQSTAIEAVNLGAYGYIQKPYDMNQLLFMIQRAVETQMIAERLRENEERYRAVFQGASEGILIADIETKKLRYANPAFCHILGYTQEDLKEMPTDEIRPKGVLAQVFSEFEDRKDGDHTVSSGIPCSRKDGTTLYVDITTAKIRIDGRECHVGFFTDITLRKQAEEALAEHRKHLEKMVRDRTVELQKTINLMSGREIRMAELKETIRKLRAQLESAGMTPVADDPLKELD